MQPRAALWKMAKDKVLEGVFGRFLSSFVGNLFPLAHASKSVAVNKPVGISSFQVIRDCQSHFNPSATFASLVEREVNIRVNESQFERRRRSAVKKAAKVKMGHGGTLDPLASGVLILGVGSGTKSLNSFLECTKTYETVVLFGASTDTYDRVGRILTKKPYEDITRKIVEEALEGFRGTYQQMPPLYSALKMNGKPLYEYAREGLPIPREIEAREVEVTELELLEYYEPGTHNHRWPAEEAESFERNYAEQVWRNQKQQVNSKKLSPEESKEEEKAIEEHETFKKEFEARQDNLVKDSPAKRKRIVKNEPLMSGALGTLPPSPNSRGKDLIPPPPPANTPPPWNDKGPPAVKIRMTVTSGFYVRSFCHDLGMKIGSAAMMAELCRSRQADFTLGGPLTMEYEDLDKGEKVWGPKVREMLGAWMESHPSVRQSQTVRASLNDTQLSTPSQETNEKQFQKSKKRATNEDDGNQPAPKRRRNSSSEPEQEAYIVQKRAEIPTQEPTPVSSAEKGKAATVPNKNEEEEEEWDGIKD
jgi:tRNA pseudouridine55 synthase